MRTGSAPPPGPLRTGARGGGGAAPRAGGRVRSRVGEIDAPVEVTDAIMPGVVSIPHGWGHDASGARLSVAAAHAGVNSNLLADETMVEPLSGNAILSGIPVEVAPAATNGHASGNGAVVGETAPEIAPA